MVDLIVDQYAAVLFHLDSCCLTIVDLKIIFYIIRVITFRAVDVGVEFLCV